MPNLMLQNVDFGSSRADQTGSSGVGYVLMDENGATVAVRTTTGVYQLASGSGLYAAYVSWPDSFNGQIMWDCPAFTGSNSFVYNQSFATEDYNVQSNDPVVEATYDLLSGTIAPQVQSVYDLTFGRWKIDPIANTMTFYRPDNVTVVAVFNLLDSSGAPAYDGVFQRVLASSITP